MPRDIRLHAKVNAEEYQQIFDHTQARKDSLGGFARKAMLERIEADRFIARYRQKQAAAMRAGNAGRRAG